jgi:hypothetical protein
MRSFKDGLFGKGEEDIAEKPEEKPTSTEQK